MYIPDRLKRSKNLEDELTKSLYSPSVPIIIPPTQKSFRSVLAKKVYPCSLRMRNKSVQRKPAKHKKSSSGKLSKRASTIVSETYNLEAEKRHSGVQKRFTAPTASPEKLTLTVVEMQQLPDIEKTDSKEEISRLKWTYYNGRRKVRVNLHTDTDKLNIVVYRYRNSSYLKDNEVGLKLTEYQSLLAKRVYLLSYIDIFYKRCILLYEKTVDI